MTDDEEFTEAVRSFGRPIMLEMGAGLAVGLIGTIQLACRHPRFTGETRRMVEGMARELQRDLEAVNPAFRLLERGWHPVFDHRPDPEDP